LKKFKIKDQIIKSVRLQGLKLTKSRAKLKGIKSLIISEGSKCTNWKPMTKMKMVLNFGADDWVWQRWNCMKLRVWKVVTGVIKSNWKNKDLNEIYYISN
jgi:hypothetical protein